MNVEAIFGSFKSKRILIVGDVMIDAYLKGKVSRISPEAPVPIINLQAREERLGGAANVAMNIKAMGAEPILCTVVGDDGGADRFDRLLKNEGLTNEGIIRFADRVTAVKTRVIGNNQQLLRVDEEMIQNLSTEQEDQLVQKVESLIKKGVDALIFEDYNKGTLTAEVIRRLIEIAKENGVLTTVDPKFENFLNYTGVTLFKPNLKELSEGLGRLIEFSEDRSQFESAVAELENKLNNTYTFVTLSEHGVFMKDGDGKHYLPAHRRSISDVSGAGDTVIAVATLCLSAGLSGLEVAQIANLAGGLVCEHRGVVPIDRDRLLSETIKTMNT
ncbi:MAG: D-glycero-beta-D-manno-heptose-7-phosphate kinase [Bacteroidetes bacterium]|nr:MAG: D-glycero-beta-D-manno-heptose-7-phosphate kinase [Bacteroidota bacterium]